MNVYKGKIVSNSMTTTETSIVSGFDNTVISNKNSLVIGKTNNVSTTEEVLVSGLSNTVNVVKQSSITGESNQVSGTTLGAIVGGKDDTAEAKKEILKSCGIHVVDSPANIGEMVKKVLK